MLVMLCFSTNSMESPGILTRHIGPSPPAPCCQRHWTSTLGSYMGANGSHVRQRPNTKVKAAVMNSLPSLSLSLCNTLSILSRNLHSFSFWTRKVHLTGSCQSCSLGSCIYLAWMATPPSSLTRRLSTGTTT